LSELRAYMDEGHFPPGSMGPKIRAAISFIENGGKEVIIGSIGKEFESIKGQAGTRIIP
jgi:carbamate kinase